MDRQKDGPMERQTLIYRTLPVTAGGTILCIYIYAIHLMKLYKLRKRKIHITQMAMPIKNNTTNL